MKVGIGKAVCGLPGLLAVPLLITFKACIILCFICQISDAYAEGILKGGIVRLEDFYSTVSATSGIQEAVDALPSDGGLVAIPPGLFLLKQSVMLRNNVTLRGSGPSTILKKCGGVETRLREAGRAGDRHIVVQNTEGLEPGMQLCIKSKEWGGWYCSQPVIKYISGNTVFLSDSLEKDYDILTSVVVNYFPALWIQGRRNVAIEGLTFDGDPENHSGDVQDFVTAAIHSVRSRNVTVRNCTVQGWPSDGIGIQGGSDIVVTECRVSECRGHGFHPGTSIRNAVFSNLISHDNAWDGLYFCADVVNISVSNGVFYNNGWNGIGGLGGGQWPDAHNIVSGNVCAGNGMSGIQGTEGSSFLIANNICRNNSRNSPGEFPGILLRNCARMLVSGNLCYDDRQDSEKTQKCGIEETGTNEGNIISNNNSWGNIIPDIMPAGN